MRRAAALLICWFGSACGGSPFGYPLDDLLRLNHLQMKGTHNSYHVATGAVPYPDFEYTHAPLRVQLAEQGVRQFELDVNYHSDEGRFAVYHLPGLDEGTVCFWLRDCLAELKVWSDANPGHHPLVVLVEPKDDLATADNTIHGRHEELDAEILAVWPRERLLVPDDVAAGFATLAGAVRQGWPTLGALRGKALFAMLDRNHDPGGHHYEYARGELRTLAGRAMFLTADPTDSYAAVILRDDPRKADDIRALAEQGFFVRTYPHDKAEDNCPTTRAELEPALGGAAHAISSNYPVRLPGCDWWTDLAPGTPTRCNPASAPRECTPEAIESPERLR